MQPPKRNFESVESLRGIAALGVFIFHWSYLFAPSLLKEIAQWGRHGVEAFFVVSGFIIPYSMEHSKPMYDYNNFWIFILKRLVRLHPPYLATIALALVVDSLLHLQNPGHYPVPLFDLKLAISHFFYANGVLCWPWLVSVFWTLGVEFQWYILIALTLPLIISASRRIAVLTVCLLIISVFFKPGNGVYVFQFLPIFASGFSTFLYISDRINLTRLFWTNLLLFFAIIYTSQFGIRAAIVAMLSILFILCWKKKFWPLKQLGKISYSLYLIHGVIFSVIFNLLHRLRPHTHNLDLLFGLFAFILTLMFSYLFYLATEKPSQNWSSKIRFKENTLSNDPRPAI